MPPLFIIGHIRSGTTLLHHVIRSTCPNIVDIEENDFEGRFFWQDRGISQGSPDTGTRCLSHDGEHINPDQITEMRKYVQDRMSDGKIVVTKNPHLCNKIGLLAKVFPEAKILHIVRHHLAVIASTKLIYAGGGFGRYSYDFEFYWPESDQYPCWWAVPKDKDRFREGQGLERLLPQIKCHYTFEDPNVFHQQYPDKSRYYPGDGFFRIAEGWLRINSDIIRQIDRFNMGDQYMAINYDDLVERPNDTLMKIKDFSQLRIN